MTDTGGTASGWPADQSGYAVILASKDAASFTEFDAQAIADQATAAGVPMVGVLDSAQVIVINGTTVMVDARLFSTPTYRVYLPSKAGGEGAATAELRARTRRGSLDLEWSWLP